MKILMTVVWARRVEVDVYPERLNDENYVTEIQNKATELAGADLDWKDGIISDCEQFPQLVE